RLTHDAVVENLRALGFVRVLADGTPHHLDELPPGLDLTAAGELLVVVDRLVAEPSSAGRLAESVATAFQEGEGIAVVLHSPLPRRGGTGSDSLGSPPAAPATRRPPWSRPPSSPSTTRAAPAAGATVSARSSSTTSRSSSLTPRAASPPARSTRGPSRATSRA